MCVVFGCFFFVCFLVFFFFFFFNDTATTEIYTLSLHDALPISRRQLHGRLDRGGPPRAACSQASFALDRKSTRLNSSHVRISYAVFCLKKKKKKTVKLPQEPYLPMQRILEIQHDLHLSQIPLVV